MREGARSGGAGGSCSPGDTCSFSASCVPSSVLGARALSVNRRDKKVSYILGEGGQTKQINGKIYSMSCDKCQGGKARQGRKIQSLERVAGYVNFK